MYSGIYKASYFHHSEKEGPQTNFEIGYRITVSTPARQQEHWGSFEIPCVALIRA